MKMRIYADFNGLDDEGNVIVHDPGTDAGPDVLSEGMIVTLFDQELEVKALLKCRYQWAKELWVAIPDWTTRRDIA